MSRFREDILLILSLAARRRCRPFSVAVSKVTVKE
jgi:hypothetical protein